MNAIFITDIHFGNKISNKIKQSSLSDYVNSNERLKNLYLFFNIEDWILALMGRYNQ